MVKLSIQNISLEKIGRWENDYEEVIKILIKSLCEAVKEDLKIRNRLRTMNLGGILFDVVSLLEQLILYIDIMNKISKRFVIGNFEIENGEIQYTISIGTERIIAGYMIKSNVMELKKIIEVAVLYFQVKSPNDSNYYKAVDDIKGELRNAINENIGLIKEDVMEMHYTLAEFVQKLILHYEEQLFTEKDQQ